MSIKIINNDQAPNRKNRHSLIYDLPEWGEVMDALATLTPGKVIEIGLSLASTQKIGTKKNKLSYFGQVLRTFFKNTGINATAWARSFPDGSERCYVKRTEVAKSVGHARAAS